MFARIPLLLGVLSVGFALGALVFGWRTPQAQRATPIDARLRTVDTVYTCSMHPQIRQTETGKCPICGMDLIVATTDMGHGAPQSVVLSKRARALAQLRTVVVKRLGQGGAEVKLLGRAEPNETTLRTVTAWTGGRIERLHVNVTGGKVSAGQVIATLYSPEIFAAHQDLLVAKRQVVRLADGAQSVKQASEQALFAARERLRLLGVPDGELATLEQAEHPARQIEIRSPFGGTVMERLAVEGAYVTTGAPLYRVANLNQIWVQLEAYESDLAKISVGQTALLLVDALPGETLSGKVSFIDPTLDPQKRTARVRVELANADGRLRPGMFVEAMVQVTPAAGDAPLVIPTTAALFTGRRSIVYVETEREGVTQYAPRTVRLGPRLGSFYPVVAGLSEGERVVSRGAFALDADLQIRGGPSMMTSPDDREPGAFDDALSVQGAQLSKLSPVVQRYLTVQRALAGDDLLQAQAASRELEDAAAKVAPLTPAAVEQAWQQLRSTLVDSTRRLSQANTLETARDAFEELSGTLAMLVRSLGNPLDTSLQLAHCPMAFGSRGASWLQQGDEIDNAYFGASMRSCGEITATIEPGAHLSTTPPGSTPARAAATEDAHQGHAH